MVAARLPSFVLGLVGRLRGAHGGNVAVEFAFVLPVLAFGLIATVDLGIGMAQKLDVQSAAQAGAIYAASNSFDAAAIQSAITGATSLSTIAATPAPTQSCGCPTGTAIQARSCSGTCPDGTTPGIYVTVGAAATYRPLLPYPVLGSTVTLASQIMVRTQ